jgi:hypothetical protein
MTDPVELLEGRFEGREQFTQLVRDAFAAAAQEGWRELVLCDPNFMDWPLGERAVVESLKAWSASGRKCTLLARRWDDARFRHARFVTWRQTWTHIIDARACPSADELELPSAIWSPAWVLQRRDPVRSTGFCGRAPERRIALREELDEWLRGSTPSFASSTVGL